ncbi:MAG TPA: hypothetical protein VF815_14430 [Myxococcaceae bacterium]
MLFWAVTSGCEPQEPSAEPPPLETHEQELGSINGISANGLSANGISANGISANGLSANGISANGLALNGLSTQSFSAWFANDPAASDMLMRYVVRCAVPAGQSRSFTHPLTGEHYTWAGNLGLAPSWANGAPASLTEQKLVTACLLAHVNQSGQHLPISVLGRNALGHIIPFTFQELMTFSVHEACFFGNIFSPQQSLYFGTDRHPRNDGSLFTRACNMTGTSATERYQDAAANCAPLQYTGTCMQRCQADLNVGPFYRSCTYNGETYPAITTRMRPQDYGQVVANLVD